MERAFHEYDSSSAPQAISYGSGLISASAPRHSRRFVAEHHVASLSDTENSSQVLEKDTDARIEKPSRFSDSKRRWIWVACISLLLLIVVAAVVGGILGSRAKESKLSSEPEVSSTGPTAPISTDFTSPGSGEPSSVNDAWALNGTSMSAITFSTTTDTSGTNYLLFYQHSNGELRKAVYNNSQWRESEFVTKDAFPGTPLAAFWKGENFDLVLYYFDQNKVLQELRGNYATSNWVNGTLGQLSISSDEPSSLTVPYVGLCQGVGTAWLVYHMGFNNQARVVYWNEGTDTWTPQEAFSDVKPGAGFKGHSDLGVWRFYYVSATTSQLEQNVCPDCCANATSTGWVNGIDGPAVGSQFGGVAAENLGLPRIVYYVDASGTIRELNNTNQYPNEVWMEDVSSAGITNGGNTGVAADPADTVGPAGMAVAAAMPNTKLSMAAGFRGRIQQVWLFYQTNGTDVTVQVRDADAAGQWQTPVSISVSR